MVPQTKDGGLGALVGQVHQVVDLLLMSCCRAVFVVSVSRDLTGCAWWVRDYIRPIYFWQRSERLESRRRRSALRADPSPPVRSFAWPRAPQLADAVSIWQLGRR